LRFRLSPARRAGTQGRRVPAKWAPSAFENVEFLIDNHGEITIGRVDSILCVPTAADEDQCMAMLVSHHGESLVDPSQPKAIPSSL
jgi:hypothetical protein